MTAAVLATGLFLAGAAASPALAAPSPGPVTAGHEVSAPTAGAPAVRAPDTPGAGRLAEGWAARIRLVERLRPGSALAGRAAGGAMGDRVVAPAGGPRGRREGGSGGDPGGPLTARSGLDRGPVQPVSPALDLRFEPTATATLGCLGAFLFPGLGHLASGQYLYRGLAFTVAVVLAAASGVALITQADSVPAFEETFVTAGVFMVVTAEIVYLWSIADALLVGVRPAPPAGSVTRLGARP